MSQDSGNLQTVSVCCFRNETLEALEFVCNNQFTIQRQKDQNGNENSDNENQNGCTHNNNNTENCLSCENTALEQSTSQQENQSNQNNDVQQTSVSESVNISTHTIQGADESEQSSSSLSDGESEIQLEVNTLPASVPSEPQYTPFVYEIDSDMQHVEHDMMHVEHALASHQPFHVDPSITSNQPFHVDPNLASHQPYQVDNQTAQQLYQIESNQTQNQLFNIEPNQTQNQLFNIEPNLTPNQPLHPINQLSLLRRQFSDNIERAIHALRDGALEVESGQTAHSPSPPPRYDEVSHLPPIQVGQFPPPAGYYAPAPDYPGLGIGRTAATRWKWIGHGWAPVSIPGLPGTTCTCTNTNSSPSSSFSGCSVILVLIIVFLTSLLGGLAFKHWQLIKLNRELTSLEINHAVETEAPEKNLTSSFFEIIFLILGGFIIIVAVLRDICRRRSNL